MSYLVFARKWRPKNFDEVIGQEHIATTLKNAISLDRVAHAYLFSGPRGIGKTSTARILAKALNCEKGPRPNPCNVCASCQEISEGRSLDVIEIDGASNRGIEQIRQLRENVKFAPAKNRFKIYIIDEVHQITTDGFNALLKTLEEPPAHVKFIFATTQPHKVIATILSRCQRFNFKPLSVAAISDKLRLIVKEEKLNVSEEVLLYIARAACGSMRDAESILDQLGSFCKGKLKMETVTSMLGMIDLDALLQIAQKIIDKEASAAVVLVEKIINEGKDLAQFIAALMEHFRHIMVSKIIESKQAAALIDLPKEQVGLIAEQAKALSLEEIFYIFNVLARLQERLRRALSARVLVEMATIKLAQREKLSSLENILAKLADLQQNLKQPSPNSSRSVQSENPSGGKDIRINNTPAVASDLSGPEVKTGDKPAQALHHDWSALLEAVKEEKMFVASALELGQIESLEEGVLTVAFSEKLNFYKETLERPENKKIIESKARDIFKRNLRLKIVLDKNIQPEDVQQERSSKEGLKNLSEQPIIQSALNIFQGRIVKRSSR